MILNICELPETLEVMRIVNIVITIIKIIVPIILIVGAMIDLVHAITNAELNKITKPMVNKIIAAILIFLIPTFVRLIANIAGNNSGYENCLKNITKETIVQAYDSKMEELLSIAEETLNINDYYIAYNYLKNIKDENKRKAYEERLSIVKELIDAQNKTYPNVEYKDYGPCKIVLKRIKNNEYGICVPEQYNGEKLPMIFFLHGMNSNPEDPFYTNFSTWSNRDFNGVINNWQKYGLKNIPAIIVMPWSKVPDKWNHKWKYRFIDEVYNEVINNYNIDTDNVCLMGHSIGGQGVFTVAAEFPTRFKSIVAMSALITKPGAGDIEYFANMPMKGFAEKYVPSTHSEYYNYEKKMTELFNNIRHPNDLRVVPVTHGAVPEYALTIDENKDGISDLIYWAINGGKDPE